MDRRPMLPMRRQIIRTHREVNMVKFEIKKNTVHPGEFTYDLRALAQSFYPELVCQILEREEWSGKTGYPVKCTVDGDVIMEETLPGDYTKNSVKAAVYRAFVKKTGRTLQWGILTGIRPAKIPLRMMMEGRGREEIFTSLRDEYLLDRRKMQLVYDVAAKEYSLIKDFDHKNSYNLYIGIPFCPSICGYCSFSSYDYKTHEDKVDAYLKALEKETAFLAQLAEKKKKKLHTIYVGGGTPTSLGEGQLQQLMDMLHRHLPLSKPLSPIFEFTVEAGRPDSITREKLRILKEAGVTRISINPQTMKQRTLDLLGRKHSVEQVREVFFQAREAGFDNINMDLIVGLPEEDESDFAGTMKQILDLDPDSVTIHTLVIKRASRMRREQLEQGEQMYPEDMLIPVLQKYSEDMLRSYGYEPYYMYRQKNKAGTTRNTNQENVAYARPGKECLYNIFIMEELETIAALGSGGSTKYVLHEEDRMERIENVKSVDDYISRIGEMIERKKKLWH